MKVSGTINRPVVPLVAWLAALLLSCESVPCEPDRPVDSLQELWETVRRPPFENEVAEQVALWLSEEIVAPEDLYIEVRDGLKLLRETWQDSIPQVETRCLPAYPRAGVGIGLTDSLKSVYLDGDWSDFDSLNELFNLDTISEFFHEIPNVSWMTLYFFGRLNSDVLERHYADVLVGARSVSDYRRIYEYSTDNLYVWKHNNKMTYLVRETWVEEPMYQYRSRFWYFKQHGDSIELVGSYQSGTPAPWWWAEARIAPDKFLKYYVFMD